MSKPISQRQAQRTRRELHAAQRKIKTLEERIEQAHLGGTHISTLAISSPPCEAAISTASRLGFFVLATAWDRGEIKFFAIEKPKTS